MLLYLTALVGFRIGERRTLAQMSPFDVIAAVAVGAIVGRVPNSADTSYLAGAATLVAVLLAHRATMDLRYTPVGARFAEHPPRVLVANGTIDEDASRQSGLTGPTSPSNSGSRASATWARSAGAVFEPRGQLSVIRLGGRDDPPDRVCDALARDAGASDPSSVRGRSAR